MKKIIFFVFSIVLSLILTLPVYAETNPQQPEPTPESASVAQADTDTFTFPQLNFTETRLIGPFDSTGIQVSFPEEWAYAVPGSLHLEYNVSIVGEDLVAGENIIAGELDVSVNGSAIAVISLNQAGEFTQDIRIPAEALVSERTDGRMEFTFDLISQESCTRDFDVNLIIHETSSLYLPHSISCPVVDLTLLPRPFYQPDMLVDRTAVLVMPDDPTPSELQAVMDVAAGFGSMSSGNLLLEVVDYGNLAKETLNNANLILIGKPSSLPLVAELDLTLELKDNSFELSDENDGVLQMAISPWNATRVVLLVSGNTDAGVIKAGQAVKSGTILTTSNKDVSMVEEFRTEVSAPLAATDRTFADLGYADRNLKTAGINYSYFEFYIPPGQSVSQEAYLNLHFNHSTLLNYDTSGLTITLNGRVIGSVRFSEDSTQMTEVQMKLPPTAFIQGTNNLQIQAQLIPLNDCTDTTSFISVWATVFSDSTLHLPLTTASGMITETLNLSDFPENLALGETQGSITFILPQDNPISWKTAAAVAFAMGDQLDNFLTQINVQFVNNLDTAVLANHNVVLVGVPSQLPVLSDISDFLPAPFESGSEVPLDRASRVVYRVTPGSDVGYIELFASPWGSNKIAMLVSGNTEIGAALAGSALSGGDLRGSLAGNFAIVSSGQIVSLDAHYPVASELLEPQAGEQEGTGTQTQSSQTLQKKMSWMLPAIFIVTVLTVVVILIKLLPAMKRKNDKGEGSK